MCGAEFGGEVVPGGAGLPGQLRQKGALSALPFAFNPGDSISIQPWQPGAGGGRSGALLSITTRFLSVQSFCLLARASGCDRVWFFPG